MQFDQGRVTVRTIGTVEQAKEGYRVIVEGIAFALAGSEDLDQVVGKAADIEGELLGTNVTLVSLSTDEGELHIDAPADELVLDPTPDPDSWTDD